MSDNERINKLEKTVNGNGNSGLIQQVSQMRAEIKSNKQSIQELSETASKINKSVSGLLKYQAENEMKDHVIEKHRKERRNLYFFIAGQLILSALYITQMILS